MRDADGVSALQRAAGARGRGAGAGCSARPRPIRCRCPRSWRKIGLAKRLRDGKKAVELYRALKQLGGDLPEAIELLTGAARPILERWFETEVLRATLATDAIIGAFTSISSPGSAYVLLHHVMGEAGGARGVWGYVRGGMGGLADALAEGLPRSGRRRAARVAGQRDPHRPPRRRAASGWSTARSSKRGRRLERRRASDVRETARPRACCRRNFARPWRGSTTPRASAKINLALAEPPQFTCCPAPTAVGPHHRGTMHIGPSLDYLERAYDDAKYGRPSREPILEMTMATSVDDTLAPPGKHILSMFVQYAPYKLAEGNWDDSKETFADRCIEVLARYAPNVPRAIEHRQVLSPLDLERMFGITGGNIMQGAMGPHQLYCFRPVAGWADHRTPVRGLYLCGAASHPGGGVMGACGKNAATEILRDRA